MTRFFSLFLTFILVALCNPVEPDPVVPSDPVQQEETKTPEITVQDKFIISPASCQEHSIDIPFTIKNANASTVLTVDKTQGIEALISYVPGNVKGTIRVTSLPELEAETSLTLNATNSDKSSSKTIIIEKAYVNIVSIDGSVTYDADTKIIATDHAVKNELTIHFETNKYIRTASIEPEINWVNTEAVVFDNTLKISIKGNFTTDNRKAQLTVYDEQGKFYEVFSIIQSSAEEQHIKERNALIAIFNALDGKNWHCTGGVGFDAVNDYEPVHAKIEYWCTDMPICYWYCVDIDPNGYVTGIDLHNFFPHGQIPEEFCDLVHLRWINLGGMQHQHDLGRYIYGKLPKGLGRLTQVETIDIASNLLEGDLDTSPIKDLVYSSRKTLVNLFIGGNNFTGCCPEWLGDMRKDGAFDISGNRLVGQVPEKVKNFPMWNTVNLGFNADIYPLAKDYYMHQQEGYGLWE